MSLLIKNNKKSVIIPQFLKALCSHDMRLIKTDRSYQGSFI